MKTRCVRRSFFDDIYGVLDAASYGFGRAVVPRHLRQVVRNDSAERGPFEVTGDHR